MQTLNEFYTKLDAIKKNKPQDTHEFLRQTIIDNTQCCGRYNDIYMACMSEMASYYKEQGNPEASLKYLTELKDIIIGVVGSESASYVSCLNNLAETYRALGDHELALKNFLEAANIMESTVGTKDYLYGQLINNIGLTYMMMGDTEKAITNIKNAVNTIIDFEECKEDTANALVNLGYLYNAAGDEKASMDSLDQALRIFENELPESPYKGTAYNCKASILFSKGQYAEAKEGFEKALACIIAASGKTPDYAVCSESAVYACAKAGDRPAALAHAKEAVEVYEKFFGAAHERTLRAKSLVEKLTD